MDAGEDPRLIQFVLAGLLIITATGVGLEQVGSWLNDIFGLTGSQYTDVSIYNQ